MDHENRMRLVGELIAKAAKGDGGAVIALEQFGPDVVEQYLSWSRENSERSRIADEQIRKLEQERAVQAKLHGAARIKYALDQAAGKI